MLDLNHLETKLDKALSQETESSLSAWLLAKRAVTDYEQFGDGVWEYKKTIRGELVIQDTLTFIHEEFISIEYPLDSISLIAA